MRDMVTNVFAAEWCYAYERTQELIPGTTDRVSVRTAGYVDQAKHFFTSTASMAFRLAFLASIAALVLGAIAPGALSVDTVFVPMRTGIDMGSHSLVQLRTGGFSGHDRTRLAVETEQYERRQFIVALDDSSTIVGFPRPQALVESMGKLTYPSDVVRFSYACRWAAPKLEGMEQGKENGSVAMYGMWAVEGKEVEEELWQSQFGPNTEASKTWERFINHASASSSTSRIS
jgi:hypothetical protein